MALQTQLLHLQYNIGAITSVHISLQSSLEEVAAGYSLQKVLSVKPRLSFLAVIRVKVVFKLKLIFNSYEIMNGLGSSSG